MADWEEREPPSYTGRFHLPHRDGSRVEVGEPVHIGGEHPWLCMVKLLGKDEATDADATLTLFVRSGRGATPDEARRSALAQLSLVMGSPVGPAPETRISAKESVRPPPAAPASTSRPLASPDAKPPVIPGSPKQPSDAGTWLSRLFGKKGA